MQRGILAIPVRSLSLRRTFLIACEKPTSPGRAAPVICLPGTGSSANHPSRQSGRVKGAASRAGAAGPVWTRTKSNARTAL